MIGIIGGVGPYAGLDLANKVFLNTKAAKDQEHLPCMLVSCPSIIPDRTEYLLQSKTGTIPNPADGLFESAKKLHAAGVKHAVVACNTAHASKIFSPFCDMVKESLQGLEIVNMLQACSEFVKQTLKIDTIGFLATIGTFRTRVYHEYFNKEDGFKLLEPDARGQERTHEAIYNEEYGIKSIQPVSGKAISEITEEILKLADRGAKAVILGCTELPLAVQNKNFPIPLIDPGLVAARKLIELSEPEKLVPLP